MLHMAREKQKLKFIWTNPNTPEQMIPFLAKWYADAIYKNACQRYNDVAEETHDLGQEVS